MACVAASGPRPMRSTRASRTCFEARIDGVVAKQERLRGKPAPRFGFVVGVDPVGQAEALKEHGADIVAADLAELLEEQ